MQVLKWLADRFPKRTTRAIPEDCIELVLRKRSSGRETHLSMPRDFPSSALLALPIETMLSPTELTDTFDIFLKTQENKKLRLSFSELQRTKAENEVFTAFLFSTGQGNASITVARKRLRPLNCTIVLSQINFTGGKTTAMISLAENLQSAGFDVTILALWLTSTPPKYLAPTGVRFDFVDSYMEMPQGGVALSIRPPEVEISEHTKEKLIWKFRNLEADVVYIPDYDTEIIPLILDNIPHSAVRILGDHNPGRADAAFKTLAIPSVSSRNKLFLQAADRADAIHIVNPSLASVYQKDIKTPVLAIPNSVADRSTAACKAFGSRRIIVIGRFVPEKCLDEAIHAFSIVAKGKADWHLDIFGQGPDEEAILTARLNSPAADRIHIHPPTPEIMDRISESAIHLSASKYESFGLTLAEAMLVGCPVIARHHIGSHYLLSDNRGRIVKDHSVESLAAALEQVMVDIETSSPELSLQINSAKMFAQKLDGRRVAAQWDAALPPLIRAKFN